MKAFLGVLLFWLAAFGQEVWIERQLANGMRVFLMPIKSDEDEVLIQLVAKGGYASLDSASQVSGRVAADMVWEVGLDGLTAEQISAKLYEASSDLQAQVLPLYRKIEGSCWKSSTKTPLEIIRLIFTEPKLSDENLKKGLLSLKQGFQSEDKDPELNLSIQAKLLNTNQWPPFKALTLQSLSTVDFKKVREFYQKAFSNPAEFTCLMVGNFDQDAVWKELQETLGKIPTSTSQFLPVPPLPSFPEGKKELTLVQKGRAGSFCLFTFPVKVKIEEKNFHSMEWVARLVEVRLRNLVKKDKKQSRGLDVSYEFPFFPYLDACWLTLHFFAAAHEIDPLSKQILAELSTFIEKGPTEEEIEQAFNQIKWTDDYWKSDDAYLLLKASNQFLWGWSLKGLQNIQEPSKLTPMQAKELLNRFVPLDNYTRIVTHP